MNIIGLLSLISVGSCLDLDQFKTESDLMEYIERTPVDSLAREDVEAIVTRLYFDAAGLIIRKAHDADIDVSVPIRNAVGDLRSKLDHLVKLLDPEFSRPQRVPPAFQWTQNDTAVFIQLKYSRRFNAPGSVDVENFNCTFTPTQLLFSAIGGHSGKRFEYALNLDFFDEIVPEQSSWNIGSVGKVLLTIAKRTVTKWPRLLLTNQKIDNMHFWYDFGEKMEASLKPLPSMAESRLTCSSSGSLFCPTSGKCMDTCADCKSKPDPGQGACSGPPAYKAKTVNFTDIDSDIGRVRGTIEVGLHKEYHRYDIDGFNVYVLQADEELTETSPPIAKSLFVSNMTYRGELPGLDISGSMELVAVPYNGVGENRERAFRRSIVDSFKPENCSRIDPISFEDTDGSEGFLKGVFNFTAPADPNNATHLVFYWGKSEADKLQTYHIFEISISSKSHNLTSATHIPTGATHIIIFAKSAGGEGSKPVGSWAVEDRYRPKGVVSDIRLLDDRSVEFKRAEDESELTGYTVRMEWKNSKGISQSKDVEVVPTAGLLTFSSMARTSSGFTEPPSAEIEDGKWKVCVYLTNKLGVGSRNACVEIPSDPPKKQEL